MALALWFLALAAVAVLLIRTLAPPSDVWLEQNFREHRADFEQIVVLAQGERGLITIDRAYTIPEKAPPSFTSDRWNEYRTVFKRVGIQGIDLAYERIDGVKFNLWSLGLAVSGASKGYLYTTTSLDGLVAEAEKASPRNHRCAQRRIEGAWYIYFCH